MLTNPLHGYAMHFTALRLAIGNKQLYGAVYNIKVSLYSLLAPNLPQFLLSFRA